MWSIRHLVNFNDTDLFSRSIEIEIIHQLGEEGINKIADIDISNLNIGVSWRFIVPKDELSYRIATQLDSLDSIILGAIIYQFGKLIEEKRINIEENKVFSYRFNPNKEGGLYDSSNSWNTFWNVCLTKSKEYEYAVSLDISDFYNQIYHHTLENQLIECNLPNEIIKYIMNLLKTVTVKLSRGIPVGPHSVHLLAEISLKPIDNSLLALGIEFCRYCDDIILFCNTENEAKILIFKLAEILDKQQRLVLQRQKTKILSKKEFQNYCHSMIEDRPINDLEKDIIKIIKKYSDGDPYKTVFISEISNDDLKLLERENIIKILDDYLNKKEPNYIRLRWFIRRLSQV